MPPRIVVSCWPNTRHAAVGSGGPSGADDAHNRPEGTARHTRARLYQREKANIDVRRHAGPDLSGIVSAQGRRAATYWFAPSGAPDDVLRLDLDLDRGRS